MVREKLAAAAVLCIFFGLSGATPARAYCDYICSMYKEGQCVEHRTTCYGSPPPPVNSYGAIAYSPGSESYGFSYNYANRAQAEDQAKSRCGKDDCVVATWFYNHCGALATNGNGTWGGAQDVSGLRAKSIAQQTCANNGGSNCEVKVAICSPH